MSLQFNVKEKANRVEVYNYKNEEDFKQFVETTNTDSSLIDCFDAAVGDINDQCNLWLSRFNTIVKRCFRKIRLKPLEMNNKVKELLLQKEALKRDIESGGFDEVESSIAEQNLQDLVQELEEVISNENKRMFVANISSVEDMDGKFSNNKGWKLKRKLAPKENSLDAAVTMKNKNGTLITDRTQLEKMYVEFYQDRMAPNQITPGLENLEHHKEELFNLQMILAEGTRPEVSEVDPQKLPIGRDIRD